MGISLSGNHFVYLKSFLLVEAALLIESVPVSGSHFVYLELFFLVEVVPFSESRK